MAPLSRACKVLSRSNFHAKARRTSLALSVLSFNLQRIDLSCLVPFLRHLPEWDDPCNYGTIKAYCVQAGIDCRWCPCSVVEFVATYLDALDTAGGIAAAQVLQSPAITIFSGCEEYSPSSSERFPESTQGSIIRCTQSLLKSDLRTGFHILTDYPCLGNEGEYFDPGGDILRETDFLEVPLN